MGIESKMTLNNGVIIPRLGFGTRGLGAGRETRSVLQKALEVGYRLFDISPSYGNEEAVGTALHSSEVTREELFIAVNYQTNMDGDEQMTELVNRSLQRLSTDYLDLLSLNVSQVEDGFWRVVKDLYQERKVRALGLCVPPGRSPERLIQEGTIVPAAVQMEVHPHLNRSDLRGYLTDKSIVTIACSPLKQRAMVYDRAMAGVGWRYGKTGAQATLRWAFQHGIVTVPRTRWKKRMKENSDLFDFSLTREEMRTIDSLNRY